MQARACGVGSAIETCLLAPASRMMAAQVGFGVKAKRRRAVARHRHLEDSGAAWVLEHTMGRLATAARDRGGELPLSGEARCSGWSGRTGAGHYRRGVAATGTAGTTARASATWRAVEARWILHAYAVPRFQLGVAVRERACLRRDTWRAL